MSRLQVFAFRSGALLLAITCVLLAIATLAAVLLQRKSSVREEIGAFAVAAVIGACWWRVMLRRMRATGRDV